MTLSIYSNLLAVNSARTLGDHYSRLSASVRRLSSGLRINSATDDAAGLAIRELMRANIAANHQGIRNANDAISLIQTADGALSVIDEKLIRMKELAEQAATGTYTSDQRLLIDAEFQAMGAEIDRIARATDFNGIKLLDGSLSGTHDGSGLTSTGAMKIHFGTGNDSAEDYYYINIGDATLAGLGLTGGGGAGGAKAVRWTEEAVIDYTNKTVTLDVPRRAAGSYENSPAAFDGVSGFDFYQLPVGLKNVKITSNTPNQNTRHKTHVCLFTKDGTQITGPPVPGSPPTLQTLFWTPVIDDSGTTRRVATTSWWNGQQSDTIFAEGIKQGIFDVDAVYNAGHHPIYNTGEVFNGNGFTVEIVAGQNEIGVFPSSTPTTDEVIEIDEITSDLVFLIGGHAPPDSVANCNQYSLRVEAEFTDQFIDRIRNQGVGGEASGGRSLSIETQESAQQALERVDDAIIKKDKIRAHLGALQNRFENTITNLAVQVENLQAAESRISDTDVATEMTEFVRNQILTQAATAMLAQANSLPQMLAGLLEG